MTSIICCRTLEDELRAAMRESSADYPVIWIESGLHNTPEKLHARLQEELEKTAPGRILVAMGFCGNSMADLKAGSHELILPKADDCISLLIGSVKKRVEISRKYAAVFLTEGWLRGERNLWTEYKYTVEQYGEEEADEIAEMMFAHYRTLGLLDSGAVGIEPLLRSSKIISDTLGLEQRVIPATLDWLKLLLTGPWDSEHFLIIPPGGSIARSDLVQ